MGPNTEAARSTRVVDCARSVRSQAAPQPRLRPPRSPRRRRRAVHRACRDDDGRARLPPARSRRASDSSSGPRHEREAVPSRLRRRVAGLGQPDHRRRVPVLVELDDAVARRSGDELRDIAHGAELEARRRHRHDLRRGQVVGLRDGRGRSRRAGRGDLGEQVDGSASSRPMRSSHATPSSTGGWCMKSTAARGRRSSSCPRIHSI